MKKLLTTASLCLLSVLARAQPPKNDTVPLETIYTIIAVLVVVAVVYYFILRKKKS
ncbi:hypothetical protein [Spirosoma gilvum]